MYAEQEAALLREAAGSAAELESLTAARVAGQPLEPLVGWVRFCGVRVLLDPVVFVPRRRSGLLVREAVRVLEGRSSPVVVDLCCGSGALGAAVAATRSDAEVHAADVDAGAVACARRNLPPGRVHHGDLLDALPAALRSRLDVLLVNAPHVPSAEVALMPREARDHEPLVALDGGPDGLDVHRRVAEVARHWLAPGGHLLLETGRRQAAATSALVEAGGLEACTVRDEHVDATVCVGRRG